MTIRLFSTNCPQCKSILHTSFRETMLFAKCGTCKQRIEIESEEDDEYYNNNRKACESCDTGHYRKHVHGNIIYECSCGFEMRVGRFSEVGGIGDMTWNMKNLSEWKPEWKKENCKKRSKGNGR